MSETKTKSSNELLFGITIHKSNMNPMTDGSITCQCGQKVWKVAFTGKLFSSNPIGDLAALPHNCSYVKNGISITSVHHPVYQNNPLNEVTGTFDHPQSCSNCGVKVYKNSVDGMIHEWVGGKVHSCGINYPANYPVIFRRSKKVTVPDIPAPAPDYRTQKARGILALSSSGYNVPQFEVRTLQQARANIGALVNTFVRPCPLTPRHGFVDSRWVATPSDALKIIDETEIADPNAELVTMPRIDAEYSGVWTPGQIAIGEGNDGATAGRGVTVTLATLGDAVSDGTVAAAGVENAPYVEMLWKRKDFGAPTWYNYFVQLRDGPKLPQTRDYIPQRIEVVDVIHAGGDLLEWEKKMKEITTIEKELTVVEHVGGSLASHYAVHCVLNGIACVTSHDVKVDDVLEPVATDASHEIDIDAMREGFVIGATREMTEKEAVYLMLAGVHHVAVWKGVEDRLLGVAMGAGYRLIVTATLGEMRHRPRLKRKRKETKGRDDVYKVIWDRALTHNGRTRYLRSLESFIRDPWAGSFGGHAWYRFGVWAAKMYNALTVRDGVAALEALNQAVHAAHNTGWGFNKFCGKDVLDETAKNPVTAILKVAPSLYQIATRERLAAREIDRVTVTPREWWKGRKPIPSDVKQLVPEYETAVIVSAQVKLIDHPFDDDGDKDGASESTTGGLKPPFFHVQYKTDAGVGKGYASKDIPIANTNIELARQLMARAGGIGDSNNRLRSYLYDTLTVEQKENYDVMKGTRAKEYVALTARNEKWRLGEGCACESCQSAIEFNLGGMEI